MTLAVNLVRTVPSAKFIKAGQIFKANIRENYYLWLNKTHNLSVLPVPLFSHTYDPPSRKTWSAWAFLLAILTMKPT